MNAPSRTEYARGTYLARRYPFGTMAGARALCADGIVRTCTRISEPDTFFSIPAAVRVAGRTVSGYVTVETEQGWTTATDDDPAVIKFIAHTYGKNAGALPAGAHVEPPTEPDPFAAIVARYDARAAERRRIERRAATFERAALAAALAGAPYGPNERHDAYHAAGRAMRRASSYDAIVMSAADRDAARAGEER